MNLRPDDTTSGLFLRLFERCVTSALKRVQREKEAKFKISILKYEADYFYRATESRRHFFQIFLARVMR
jgi:hypothetical protein